MKPIESIAILKSRQGGRIAVAYSPDELKPLVTDGKVDAYIVSTEDGFSPLGVNRSFIASELGIPEDEIMQLADWNRFKNPRVSLVALQSRRKGSKLRGVILAASETSESYKQFAVPYYGRPYRDFYYNVTYESIAYACGNWGAQFLALSHLSGSGTFHQDIATCNAEALAHFCDATPTAEVESLIFVGCCISREHLDGIACLNPEAQTGQHHPISTEIDHCDGHDLVHLTFNQSS